MKSVFVGFVAAVLLVGCCGLADFWHNHEFSVSFGQDQLVVYHTVCPVAQLDWGTSGAMHSVAFMPTAEHQPVAVVFYSPTVEPGSIPLDSITPRGPPA